MTKDSSKSSIPMSSKVFYEKRIKKNIKKKQQTNTQEQDLKICTIYLLEKRKDIASVKSGEKRIMINEFDLGNIFELPFKITLESKVQSMQYQILHRIVTVNNFLYKI